MLFSPNPLTTTPYNYNTKVGVLANKINDSTGETVTASDNDRERLMKSAPQFVETAKLRPWSASRPFARKRE